MDLSWQKKIIFELKENLTEMISLEEMKEKLKEKNEESLREM